MRRILAIAIAAIFLVEWCAGTGDAPPVLDDLGLGVVALPVEAPQSIDELRTKIAAVLAREHVPGVGLALVGRDGPIWIGGVGVADEATRAPVTADTVFRVASITKSIVALGVMRLVEQGKLRLDQPVVETATLAQALEHTAALDDMRFNETFTDDETTSVEAALAINPRSRALRWQPGTRMAYSNVGYTLAARAIEAATGESFDAWLVREIVRPLGMPDAEFRRTPALAAKLATGYVAPGRAAPFRPIAHRAAGALLASATDLAKLVQFMLRRDGALVSRAGLDRIERGDTLPYGALATDYGLGNGGDVTHAVPGRGHDGGLPGFLSSLRYFPAIGSGYVMLLDATFSWRAYQEISALLFAYLARDRVAVPVAAVAAAPPSGFYRFASPRHALLGFLDGTILGWRAIADGDGTRLDPLFGGSIPLVADGDAYRTAGESGTSVRFATVDGERVMISGYFGYAEAASYRLARAKFLGLLACIWLLQLAPLVLFGAVVLALIRRTKLAAYDLLLWPALAGVCFDAVPRLFIASAMRQTLGECNAFTVGICAATLGFATSAFAGAIAAWRWSRRADRPSIWMRLVPMLCIAAALAITAWLGANGIIGLRTWAH